VISTLAGGDAGNGAAAVSSANSSASSDMAPLANAATLRKLSDFLSMCFELKIKERYRRKTICGLF
jgi:hypothetical protein